MSDQPPLPHILYIDEAGEHLFVPSGTPPDPPDPPDPPESQAKCQITLGQDTLSFDPKQGQTLDSYVDPEGDFVMGNVLCVDPANPAFRAYYRQDWPGDREEWVFEYGDPWMGPPDASLPPYSVDITCANGDTVYLEAPVGHYWYSRWRWQSAPRPVRTDHDMLAHLNRIPYLDCTGLATGSIPLVPDYSPMAYCGIPSNQGQTGGYAGLGIITGWQAQYLVRGAPESSFRNQAEASGTFQAFVRDTNTQAPIDLIGEYPKATMYSASQGTPFIARGPSVNRTDQGHMPSVTYVPFLLTGDPYYLEACQFWANHNMLTMPSGSRFMVAGRYLAWPARAIHECVLATPDTVPSWLLPKSYWLTWLEQCRGYITSRMANTADPYYYTFHTIPDTGQSGDLDPGGSGDHVWQQNMLELVAAWIACTQEPWRGPAEWLIANGIARASDTSGWVRSRPSPYHIRLQHAGTLKEAMNSTQTTLRLIYPQPGFKANVTVKVDSETMTLKSVSPDGLDWSVTRAAKPSNHNVKAWVYGPKCASWKEAADLNVFTYGWDDTANNDHLSPKTTDLTYHSYQRAALAQALHAGLQTAGLKAAYDWLNAEIRNLVTAKRLQVGENWCVMPATGMATGRRWPQPSDSTDIQLHPDLADILDALRELGGDEIPDESYTDDPDGQA